MTPYFETKLGKLYQGDCILRMRERAEYSTSLIFCDPPYALGSKVGIMQNGKPEYTKAIDFMDKWDMPNGAYWEDWFKEAYRMLKHGGYCVMYGMDRQLLMFKYYASMAGFAENQSLYWFYISSFPKSANLSKNLDKHQGMKQEVVGQQKITGQCLGKNKGIGLVDTEHKTEWDITKSTSELGKKYDGYKYGVAPLKQTNETIMVFQKPYKTGSCLHDTIAYEKGDTTCMCGALDIENSRCGSTGARNNGNKAYNKGRYPAQTFVNDDAADLIDGQTGISGGGSKILHKCNYEQGEYDIYHYNPKVSRSERNAGCDGLGKKESVYPGINTFDKDGNRLRADGSVIPRLLSANHHPTCKPISLNTKLLTLFKTPDEQSVFIPFCGSGSEVIGAIQAGYTDWEAVEINPEYCEIAANRIEKASEQHQLFDGVKNNDRL